MHIPLVPFIAVGINRGQEMQSTNKNVQNINPQFSWYKMETLSSCPVLPYLTGKGTTLKRVPNSAEAVTYSTLITMCHLAM